MKNRPSIDNSSFKKLQEKKEVLTKIESLPYSENLRSVMDSSVYTSSSEQYVKQVVKKMSSKGISSVIVVNKEKQPIGILTEKDIMRRIVAEDGVDINSTSVAQVMTSDPVFLSPEDTIYRAMSIMSSRSIKHLPLVSDNKIAGIVTFRQLLKLKYPEPMTLIESLRNANDVQKLKAIKDRLVELALIKYNMGVRAYDIVVMLSMLNQDIHRKTFELAVQKTGDLPAPICLYVTGSHGRMENLLSPDQDHGMIIDNTSAKDIQYDPYFVDLTQTFSDWLNTIGFVNCPGHIMCLNPVWRKSLPEWKMQIQYWFEKQVAELGRYVTVLFDAMPILGDFKLFAEVNDYAFMQLDKHHEILRVLHEEEGKHIVPTGIFGRFITERKGENKGELNIKRSGLIFVVEAIRILALQHGIRETSTIKRLADLVEHGFIHRDDGEYFESAYLVLLHFALGTQLEKTAKGEKITPYLNPYKLSRRDRETLRHTYKAVASLQDLVASELGEFVI